MILVTGATGYVGRRVVANLYDKGRPVRVLVRSTDRASVLSGYDLDVVEGDVLVPESLARACDGVEAVIHLVAVVREKRDATFRRVNYEGARKVLEAAQDAGVGRIVFASTIGASSDPTVPYLYSRWMAEEEAARSPVPHTVLRFSIGFGEGDEFLNRIAALVKASPLVPVAGDGAVKSQPIAVDDVARCLTTALERDDMVGKTIELGGPAHLTYDQIIDLVAETLGAKVAKVHVPAGLMQPAAAILEALTPSPQVTPSQLKMLRLDNVTELDSVESNFGFIPRSIIGNIDYVNRIGLLDALKMNLGFIPEHIRDH